jgi:hypothetical protein
MGDCFRIKRSLSAMALTLVVLLGVFAVVGQANAILGESVDSVKSDRTALSALRYSTTKRNGYTVQEMVSPSTVVREYISPSGIVFAIGWNGLVHPDLTRLLGSYADEYQQALRQTSRKPGQRRTQVKARRVVVEKWGRMRNLQGRVYAPDLMPSEVSIDEIR